VKTLCLILLCATGTLRAGDLNQPWRRHVIDDSSRGADGTRLGDANGDGLPDIVTGWEQGGVTRVYLNPGPSRVKSRWPSVTVGAAQSVEDAVFMDVDGDGALDVVSSCEGRRQTILIHWAPRDRQDYLKPERWRTEELPGARDRFRWMFAAPMDVDGDGQLDLLAGGKGAGSELGWWRIPKRQPRNLADWKWIRLRAMGWLMSLEPADMDGDGDLDVVFSDRKGRATGAFWLERRSDGNWREHLIGAGGREAMFLKRADLDADGLEDVIVAVRPRQILFCRRLDASGTRWREYPIDLPARAGDAKAPAVADFDGDGAREIVFTTERAKGKEGVARLLPRRGPTGKDWAMKPVSGVDGVKHDLVELLDLDADGDLDVITCEEVTNLGVIWYENPRY